MAEKKNKDGNPFLGMKVKRVTLWLTERMADYLLDAVDDLIDGETPELTEMTLKDCDRLKYHVTIRRALEVASDPKKNSPKR
jgi:hypothetical protein